jgi:hypothetical protein
MQVHHVGYRIRGGYRIVKLGIELSSVFRLQGCGLMPPISAYAES